MTKDPKDVATAIGDQLATPSVQARESGLDTLSYLIEVARMEAEQAIKNGEFLAAPRRGPAHIWRLVERAESASKCRHGHDDGTAARRALLGVGLLWTLSAVSA
jgi:hypothetical protein